VGARVWWGILRGKRPPGRPRRRWENNVRVNLPEVGWGQDWIDLVDIETGGGIL
jgi:hypothetical protein